MTRMAISHNSHHNRPPLAPSPPLSGCCPPSSSSPIRMPIFVYAAPVTGTAAIALTLVAAVTETAAAAAAGVRGGVVGWALSGRYAVLVLYLALVPGIIGHTGFNTLLRCGGGEEGEEGVWGRVFYRLCRNPEVIAAAPYRLCGGASARCPNPTFPSPHTPPLQVSDPPISGSGLPTGASGRLPHRLGGGTSACPWLGGLCGRRRGAAGGRDGHGGGGGAGCG